MRNVYVTILILFSFLIIKPGAKAQSNLIIKNVTVINPQGHVRISWEYSGTDNLEISRDNEFTGSLTPIYTVTNLSTNSYIDVNAEAHLRPRSYRLQSVTTASDITDKVSTFYLTYDYDSCLSQINLSWDDLEAQQYTANDWTPDLFVIHITEDGNPTTVNVNPADQEYTIENVLENTNYQIFIETQWLEEMDSTSWSNPVSKFTEMPQSPDYINSLLASANGENVDLKFEIAPNSELNIYKLLKAATRDGNYDTLETFNTSNSEITATDNNADPTSEVGYYKLVSVNKCGNETTVSDIINNIVLEVENNDYTNSLQWTEFKEGAMVSSEYEIYRIIANSPAELIGSRNFNFYDDNIESLKDYNQFCYYVEAKETGGLATDISRSNTVCIYFEPRVNIPQAFTPNDDGTNDCFKVCGNFETQSYDLKIYDRWGTIIYETNSYTPYSDCDNCDEGAWNGKDKNGNSVPAGVYVYILNIKLINGKEIDKRGNITVIYP